MDISHLVLAADEVFLKIMSGRPAQQEAYSKQDALSHLVRAAEEMLLKIMSGRSGQQEVFLEHLLQQVWEI